MPEDDGIDWNALTGGQLEMVRNALLAAFDRRGLQRFLADQFSIHLEELIAPGPFEHQVFDLIESIQREGWLGRFIAEVRSNSSNLQVRDLAAALERGGKGCG
ncbi:MAG: hypothetical protein QOD42_1443 [Sphingomonadales bacterium]|jgi:hypothetical protein|nr:hypothetical protein [Sphingomonadales bacterium]